MPGTVRVKICGIMSEEIAGAAVAAGADALGFVFAQSRRRVTAERARQIIATVPPFISRAGVFVDSSPQEVLDIVNYCGLDSVQLHGEEDLAEYKALLHRTVKVILSCRVKGEESVSGVLKSAADAYLFDTYKKGMPGGTGEVFDWRILKSFTFPAPVILSGGLNTENVAMAVETVKPFAVDVSSGVETDGVKDVEKIKTFIKQAKGVHIND
ncbi:Phosphoribosylanthranilate isomerase [Desulfofarcimen acetoxidans DSM 771]|jgi:phosphoribosylanthranilate isomerase|uniref:N-(5'-phosphoribosyl)anthranilate isomerase n=1 Tax=Desulfofarcimen acetoxidans (strain ATCC 49208 / DSM 771 / KCTC 5769 / VKM B-1644 / 5575) TaxID=485916 RepID=C8W337_DESAS|nr:phosphoribosylanthranilate isomerase [Desulfofarcimen acetoxidans]ACV61804.1 Phosphoribosylanthranilate isomerase [Desulfofarcimen acetoxidans DSM 771]